MNKSLRDEAGFMFRFIGALLLHQSLTCMSDATA